MRLDQPLLFHGYMVWLTPEQGGRDTGPPPTPRDQDYAATAYIPPASLETGLASVVLRLDDRTAWRSTGDADWLVVDHGDFPVERGDVLVVTEGHHIVGYFHIEVVDELRR
jgi:hypothetical protein